MSISLPDGTVRKAVVLVAGTAFLCIALAAAIWTSLS